MHAITVLLNPRVGREDAGLSERIASAFAAARSEADLRVTPGPAIANAAREAISDGATVVVAAGGDGTISAAASGILGTDAALGVLPLGTLNHFAKDLAIPLEVDEAARTIAAGRTMQIDVGDVNGRPFINNASIGMYARLIAERNALQQVGRPKWVAHGLAALRVWRRYQRLRVTIGADNVQRWVRTPFVFVGNNEYQLSGLELGGRQALDRGRLQVCMAAGMTRRGVAHMIFAAVFGDVRTLEEFEVFTATTVTLAAGVKRLQASVDGEAVTLDNPLTFHIRPGALRVIVP